MTHAAALSAPTSATSLPTIQRRSLLSACFTAIATTVSGYFFLVCAWFYWVAAGAAWLLSFVLPRSLIERAPLAFLTASSAAMAAATQTVPGLFPDYTSLREIGAELLFWLTVGLFARCYLIYTDFPNSFEGLKQSIQSRPLERWIAQYLHHEIDAVYTRIWVANTVAIIPVTALLVMPSTLNYFVFCAYSVSLLIGQFPHELIDHVNIHTRVFQPKSKVRPGIRRLLRALQFYFEYPHQLLLCRAPQYHRIQHVYVHHVEDNGPRDSQTTAPYDRTSFLDFSRHAFIQGIDMLTGYQVFRYLAAKGKKRQFREAAYGFVVWYAFLIVLAVINPLAAAIVFLSRFIGGNIISLVSFWQHGLVDPEDVHDIHGNSVNFISGDHGNLGSDYHVEHHLQPGRHWSNYYTVYQKGLAAEGGYQAVVMQKEMFGPLAFVSALWARNFDLIATNAHLHGVATEDKATLARVVEERTRPIDAPERRGLAATVDRGFSRIMSHVMPTRFYV